MTDSNHKQKLNKIMTEKEAVETFLKDGESFTVGGFLMNRESECIFREIARQGKKHLNYIEESSTTGIDILIGMGAIDRFDVAYMPYRQIGGIMSMPSLDRSFKEGNPRPVNMGNMMKTENYCGNEEPLEIVDWTNFMISLRFVAGSMNVPFMPCRSSLGSDIPKLNNEIKIMDDPFENKPVALIPAYKPDVAFIAVQRADRRGNGQVFGYKGTDEWKARAAKHVVLIAEELVSSEEILKHPSNTVVPAYCSDAVVVLPYNSHPFSVYGCYMADSLSMLNTVVNHQSTDGYKAWMDEWVFGCKDHFEYCDNVGWDRLERLAKSEQALNQLPAA